MGLLGSHECNGFATACSQASRVGRQTLQRLLDDHAQDTFCTVISKKSDVHIATPSSSCTFSAGRNDRVLRSLDQPWGVDGLCYDLQLKNSDGNRFAKAIVDVLMLCLPWLELSSVALFENP